MRCVLVEWISVVCLPCERQTNPVTKAKMKAMITINIAPIRKAYKKIQPYIFPIVATIVGMALFLSIRPVLRFVILTLKDLFN